MFESVENALGCLRTALAELDPSSLDGDQAARLVELFVETERLSAAGRTLAAHRVEESKVWQRDGHRTAASWLAAVTGDFVGRAIESLETGDRLKDLPATRRAFCSGELSEPQAMQIASAAVDDPQAEERLLALARTSTVAAVRSEARRIKAAAHPDEASRYAALHKSRYLRHWSDEEGAVRLSARLAPDAGAAVIAALDGRKEGIVDDARRQGRREPFEAYAADALVDLVTASSAAMRAPKAMVHVLVDHSALVRGAAEDGERCEIPGIGPIPVATARALGTDAIWKAILTDGVDVKAVAHLGRTVSAHVRTALEVRDPECVVPECDIQSRLQIDHWRTPYGYGGATNLDNLARICGWHHYLKTYLGFRLTGGPGAWEWCAPVNRSKELVPVPDDP